MARNQEKIERNKIRQKYAREFAGKLSRKDDRIRALQIENEGLRAQIGRLEKKSALDSVTIQRLDDLVKTLQAWTELSDKELEDAKAGLAAKAAAKRSVDALNETMSGIDRALGGAFGSSGLQSMFYSLMGLGALGQERTRGDA